MPEAADEVVLRQAHDELALDGSNFLLDAYAGREEDFEDYLQRVSNSVCGRNLLPDRVQSTFLVAEVDGEVVGRSSIRRELNDWLLQYGGHIGYAVRPEFRQRGYATEILRQSLQMIQGLGINRVLMTCNDDNIASQKVIEKHGGLLENKVMHEGALLRRYWIQL